MIRHARLPPDAELVTFVEQCGELPELHAKLPPGGLAGRGFAGTELSFDHGGDTLFDGVITHVNTGQQQLKAMSTTVARCLPTRGMSVFPASDLAVEVLDLTGLRMHFGNWIDWADLGNLTANCVYQYDESDWQFAQRIAAMVGYYLLVNPVSGSVEATKVPNDTVHDLTEVDIVPETDFIDESLVLPSCRRTVWNAATGAESESVSCPNELSATELAVAQFIDDRGIDETESGGVTNASTDIAEFLATRDARFQRGAMETWGARIRHRTNIKLNDQVNLSDGLGGGSYVVWRRTLTFAHGDRYLDIVCRNSQAGFPELLDYANPPQRLILMFGGVIDSNDPQRLGRVKVRLVGQPDQQAAWCHTLHSFLGTCQVPSPDDQVALLVEPYSISAPLCLGAVYFNGHQVPEAVNNPGIEKLIFELPNSLQMIAKSVGNGEVTIKVGGISLSVTPEKVSVTRV